MVAARDGAAALSLQRFCLGRCRNCSLHSGQPLGSRSAHNASRAALPAGVLLCPAASGTG